MNNDWDLRRIWYQQAVSQLQSLRVDILPIAVCGLLCSLLPPTEPLAKLRTALGCRLRARLQPDWLQTAELAEVCAALDGLHHYNPSAVTGNDLALFVQRILAAESTVGGPYRDHDGSVQASTNALVQQCLAWAAKPLPNVAAFLQSFQPNLDIPMGSTPAEQTMLLVLQPNSNTRQPLHTKQLRSHGRLFTTALLAGIAIDDPSEPSQSITIPNRFIGGVHTHARANVHALPEPFAGKTRAMLEQVIAADGSHEITGLAWMYGHTYNTGQSAGNHRLYEHYALANLYAWGAYTIYDDFLDNEGDPTLLATANYLLRAMLGEYQTALPSQHLFWDFVEQTLRTVDAANTRETTLFRFQTSVDSVIVTDLPDYGDGGLLADRALFHIIGPMGVLAAANEPIGSETWNNTLDAFRHYLIARQLNDDIHDWVQDLASGQASYVVVALLRHLGITPGTYRLNELLAYGRQAFWQEVLPGICDTATMHLDLARGIPFPNSELFERSQLLSIFNDVEASMQAARQQRLASYEFMNQFSAPTAT